MEFKGLCLHQTVVQIYKQSQAEVTLLCKVIYQDEILIDHQLVSINVNSYNVFVILQTLLCLIHVIPTVIVHFVMHQKLF
jgi:hypothetical protein